MCAVGDLFDSVPCLNALFHSLLLNVLYFLSLFSFPLLISVSGSWFVFCLFRFLSGLVGSVLDFPRVLVLFCSRSLHRVSIRV